MRVYIPFHCQLTSFWVSVILRKRDLICFLIFHFPSISLILELTFKVSHTAGIASHMLRCDKCPFLYYVASSMEAARITAFRVIFKLNG